MSYRIGPDADGVPPVRRGRPPDPRREAAILKAALELNAEVGYEAVSIEAVAARAGASKATIYRRWSNKRQLLAAAVRAQQGPPVEVVDTGSLRGDLVQLCRRLAGMLEASNASLILALLQAAAEDPLLGDLMEVTAGHTGARLPPEVLDRAVRRGELPAGTSTFAFDETAGSVLIMRTLTGHRIDESYLRHLVDAVLLPALRHGTGTASGPGLFAGPGPAPGVRAPAARPPDPPAITA